MLLYACVVFGSPVVSGVLHVDFFEPPSQVDHVAGLAATKRAFPEATLLMHSRDEPVRKDAAARARDYGFDVDEVPAPDALLDDACAPDAAAIRVGSTIALRALFTPGHCPGHVVFWDEAHALAIVGDMIFQGSIGRTDLPLCDPREMQASLRLLLETLPPETALLPGHMGTTTMGHERQNNPFLLQLLGAAS